MKEKLQSWARKQVDDIREISKEFSWSAKSFCKEYYRKGYTAAAKPAQPHYPSAQHKLTEEMDRAIHRAYYQDGGFRFFACALRQYVMVAMQPEHDLETTWAAVYNTNLRPMLRQMDKLEQKLKDLRVQYDCEPLKLNNARLLEQMRILTEQIHRTHLDGNAGWSKEEYQQAAREYVSALNEQLLDRYQPVDEK